VGNPTASSSILSSTPAPWRGAWRSVFDGRQPAGCRRTKKKWQTWGDLQKVSSCGCSPNSSAGHGPTSCVWNATAGFCSPRAWGSAAGGRRPAAICASTGRMKGDERGNREISGLRPASAALAPRSQRPAAICAGTWRTKGEERGDLRNFRPHAYAADQRAVLARSGRWMQLRLCVRLRRRAYGPRQEKASG